MDTPKFNYSNLSLPELEMSLEMLEMKNHPNDAEKILALREEVSIRKAYEEF